jgi:osmotically-inducible protein OsmY
MKAAVEREVSAIDGVQSVVNDLEPMGTSSFTARSSDSLITGQVKASFVDSKELYANAIKVVTERSTVYLMGRVTEREGQLAASLASGVNGVQKVVKIFEYISDDELKRLTSEPESQAKK